MLQVEKLNSYDTKINKVDEVEDELKRALDDVENKLKKVIKKTNDNTLDISRLEGQTEHYHKVLRMISFDKICQSSFFDNHIVYSL